MRTEKWCDECGVLACRFSSLSCCAAASQRARRASFSSFVMGAFSLLGCFSLRQLSVREGVELLAAPRRFGLDRPVSTRAVTFFTSMRFSRGVGSSMGSGASFPLRTCGGSIFSPREIFEVLSGVCAVACGCDDDGGGGGGGGGNGCVGNTDRSSKNVSPPLSMETPRETPRDAIPRASSSREIQEEALRRESLDDIPCRALSTVSSSPKLPKRSISSAIELVTVISDFWISSSGAASSSSTSSMTTVTGFLSPPPSPPDILSTTATSPALRHKPGFTGFAISL